MTKSQPPVNRQSEISIETTPTMRKKAHSISRCFISIMKLLRVFKCGKKKHKTNKIWHNFAGFWPSFNFSWFAFCLLLRTLNFLGEPLFHGCPRCWRLTHRFAVRNWLLPGLRKFFFGSSLRARTNGGAWWLAFLLPLFTVSPRYLLTITTTNELTFWTGDSGAFAKSLKKRVSEKNFFFSRIPKK